MGTRDNLGPVGLGVWERLGLVCLGVALWGAGVAYVVEYYRTPPTVELAGLGERVWLVVERDGAGGVELVDVRAPIWVDVGELPDHLVDLVVFQEDRTYWRHGGLDPAGVGRAAVHNVLHFWGGRHMWQGGSTISQQTAKNVFFGRHKTFGRKLRELVLTLKLEEGLDKESLLTLYLNSAPFGVNTYGIEAASRRYFRKPARELNGFESAVLVAGLRAPSVVNWKTGRLTAQREALALLWSAGAEGVLSREAVAEAMARGAEPGGAPLGRPGLRWIFDGFRDAIGAVGWDRAGRYVVYTAMRPGAELYRGLGRRGVAGGVVFASMGGGMHGVVGADWRPGVAGLDLLGIRSDRGEVVYWHYELGRVFRYWETN